MHRQHLHFNKLPITVIYFNAKLKYKNFKFNLNIIFFLKILTENIIIFVHIIINKKKTKVLFTTIT